MDFSTWLSNCGGKVHPELDLFHTLPSGDRGVVARSDVAEGELLLLLPIDCAIYIPTDDEFNKRPETFPEAVRYLRESHSSLSPFLATTLVLMSEVARGSTSPWAAYVATLPPSCPDCLLNWSEEDKRLLEGTSLEQSGPDPAADVYIRHVAHILAARSDLWPGLAAEGPGQEEGAGGAKGAAGQEAPARGLQAFLRVAGLVQSRAFHLEAENWVSGAKQIAKLEGGGTQVFLLPGIDMINHSHNPARRNAHLERLNVAQAVAAKLLEAAVPAEAAEADAGATEEQQAGKPAYAEAFFVMRADKPIKAGEEVLHTYGNLSDAQLLQTYGFLDSDDAFLRDQPQSATAAAAATAPSVGGPSPSRKNRAKAGDGDAADANGDGDGEGYRNPYNAALVPWTVVEEICTGLLRSMDQAPSGPLQRAKRDFLASAGVLQAAAPESTQFVLLAQEPLPDELTTAVQVLLMTKDEFQELRREFGGAGDAKSAGQAAGGKAARGKAGGSKAGGSKAGGGGKAADGDPDGGDGPPPGSKLSLGTALLEEDPDFAEMVCIASLQVLEACMERYPGSVKDDVRLLRSPECTGRKRLALRVRLGEKDVLQLAKKAVVELMRKLQEGGEMEEEEGADDESDHSESGDQEEEEEEKKGGKGRRRASKRQRRGLGAKGDKGGADGGGSGNSDDDDDGEAADGLLMGSDDSDKVGYGAEEYDDGIGEAHDRGKAHEPPRDD